MSSLSRRLVALAGVLSLAWASPSLGAEPDRNLRSGRTVRLDPREEARQQLDTLAQQTTVESIRRLEELIAKTPAGHAQRPEMLLRLADLYYGQGRRLFLAEEAAFIERADRCFDTPGCRMESMVADHSGSAHWYDKSIRTYQALLRQAPRFERADEATYYLGSSLMDRGRAEEAADAFKRLVRTYADSELAADAYVQLGDYYFEVREDAFGALRAYQRAAAAPESANRSWAQYRMAWCYYNLGELRQAIDALRAVATEPPAEGSAVGLQLQDEALRDLVRFYADADAIDEATRVLTAMGREDLVRATLRRLASVLFEQGKFDRSVEMYRRLQIDDPLAPDNPLHQANIVRAYRQLGRHEQVLSEITRLAEGYGPGSAWAQANETDARSEAADTVEKELRRVAVQWQEAGRQFGKTRRAVERDRLFGLSAQAYAAWLDRFADREEAYDVSYGYAELLYDQQRWGDAYDAYMQVVARDASGRHARHCAEGAVLAAQQLTRSAPPSRGRRVDATLPPRDLSAAEQNLVAAYTQFARLFPDDARTPDALYKAAYELYDARRFDEAAPYFQRVIALDPGSQEAELSAQLILDALAVQESWETLQRVSKAFHETEGLGSRAFRADALEVYQRASYRLIEVDLERTGDAGAAAEAFVAYAETFPQADTAALALHNATVQYEAAGRDGDAVPVRHVLVEDPRFGAATPHYYEQLRLLGYAYEASADFGRAATYYEHLWSDFGEAAAPDRREQAGDALWAAAVFRQARGEAAQALTNLERFVRARADDTRVPEARMRIAAVYAGEEQWEDAADAYRAFAERPPAGAPRNAVVQARLRAGHALARLGREAERDAWFEDAIGRHREEAASDPQIAHDVAEMMFTSLLADHDAYLGMRLEGADDEAIGERVQAKVKALAQLEVRFGEVVELGDGEWGLAALVALGEAYDDMARSLRRSPDPGGLTEEQRDYYRRRLDDGAYTQEEKAVRTYHLALSRAHELALYDHNAQFAATRLGELRPDDHPGLEEALPETVFTASSARRDFPYETTP